VHDLDPAGRGTQIILIGAAGGYRSGLC